MESGSSRSSSGQLDWSANVLATEYKCGEVITCVVRLHALQSRDEHSTPVQIVGLLLSGDGTLDGTAGPECMVHGAPGVLGVGAKVRGAILADGESGGIAGDFEVHDAVGVDGGLDGVGVTLLIESDGQVIGAKGEHVLVEHEVLQSIGVPDVGAVALEVEDLGVEVRGSVEASRCENEISTSGNIARDSLPACRDGNAHAMLL